MRRSRQCGEGCPIAKVGSTCKFIFKLFRALLKNVKTDQGSEELVGVVDGGVVEAKGKEERIAQTFKVSSKLWVCRPIHKWKGTNAEWDLQ